MVRSCRNLAICASLLLSAPLALVAANISGRVPLPESPAAPVLAQRYKIVSKGNALATVPPLAVVYLEGDLPMPEKLPDREILQENFIFEPALLAVPVGTRVFFPNRDDEYHNVFSFSPTKRFDLGRYPADADPVPSQIFNTPGVVILRCDIHEHMRAIILVLDTPCFVLSEPDGTFALPDVPAGEYTLRAWVDTSTILEKQISLAEGEDLVVEQW